MPYCLFCALQQNAQRDIFLFSVAVQNKKRKLTIEYEINLNISRFNKEILK
jgi:hypothetical protein